MVEHAIVNVELVCIGFHIFKSQHGTFLHHVAQVAGKGQFRPLAAADTRLDEENLAAHGGPGQSSDYTRVAIPLVFVTVEDRFTQQFREV